MGLVVFVEPLVPQKQTTAYVLSELGFGES